MTYRAQEAERIGRHGRKLRPHSVLDSHKALFTSLRWARARKYEFDPSILELKRPRVPKPEADVYHMSQLRAILAACNRSVAQEKLMVRVLVGSGCARLRALRARAGRARRPVRRHDGLAHSRPGGAASALGRRRQGEEIAAGADHAEAGGGD